MTITNESFPLDQSLCRHCIYRMSTILKPLNLENFGLDDEAIEEMDISKDDEIQIEQHMCLISRQDMDYVVTACNYFKDREKNSLLFNNPY